jgi:hypothetical protein
LEFGGVGETIEPENGRSGSVKYRIAMWVSAGLLVVACWQLYIFATAPIPISVEPIVWTLARLTCPVVFASFYFHFGVGFYSVLLANAATYALVGLIVETLRHQLHHR